MARGLRGWVIPWDGVLLGVGLGVSVTVLATLQLARAASWVSSLEAMGKGGAQAWPAPERLI